MIYEATSRLPLPASHRLGADRVKTYSIELGFRAHFSLMRKSFGHLLLSRKIRQANLARIFHEYLIRKHINNLLCNQSVFLLETLFLRKASP